MEINDLIQRVCDTREHQAKAIFSSLFMIGNRLQTLFDQQIPQITLRQFMLLTMVRQSKEQLTFTQLGKLLGCSRQNIKKLAALLEKKGFVIITTDDTDGRASHILATEKLNEYFENVFYSYEQELHILFAHYTDEEINQLFQLIVKLFEGVDHLKSHGAAQNETRRIFSENTNYEIDKKGENTK